MTDAVQIELIRASVVIVPCLIGVYTAHVALKAASQATSAASVASEVKTEVGHLVHATNSMLEQAKIDAEKRGEATGKAAGIEQERNRDQREHN